MSLQGPRRGWEAGRQVRAYSCRNCGHTERDYWPPFGWLQVRTRDPQAGSAEHTYALIGLLCSAACLRDAAAGWANAAAAEEAR